MRNLTSPREQALRKAFAEGTLLELCILVALLVVPLVIRSPYYQDWFVMAFILAGASCAWNIVGGYTGLLSVGHAAFFGIGAYASALMFVRLGISPWIGMLVGCLFSAVAAGIIGLATLRLRGTFFVLVTIAFCEVLRFTAIGWRELSGGSMGITIMFRKSFANMMWQGKRGYLLLAFAYMVLVYAVCKIIERRKIGYSLVAIREDQDAARACGVPAANVKTMATILSAVLTSIAGSIYAQYLLYIEPDVVFDIMISVQIILIGILGGKGKAFGPIVGALFIIPFTSFLRGQLSGISGLHGFIYGLALVLIMIFLPEGVYGRLWRWARTLGTRRTKESSGD